MVKSISTKEIETFPNMKILTIDEVAEYSRLSIKTIRRDVTLGKLEKLKRKGRLLFRLEDVDGWLGVY